MKPFQVGITSNVVDLVNNVFIHSPTNQQTQNTTTSQILNAATNVMKIIGQKVSLHFAES